MQLKNKLITAGAFAALCVTGFSHGSERTEPSLPVTVINITPAEPFTIIHQDNYKVSAADSQKKAIVLSSAAEYQQLLAQYTTDNPADVDFSQNKVLLVESGSKPNSGFGVKINGIIEHSDRVVAHVSYLTPDDNPACSYLAVMTQPYLFAKIATDKPLLVREHTEVQPCIKDLPDF